MDVDVVEEENGSYIVSMHGRSLVYFDQVQELKNKKTLSDDGLMVNTPVYGEDSYPFRPGDGRLAGQIELRDKIVPSYQKDLDTLAANFIWEFNRTHSQLTGLQGYSQITALYGPKNPQDTLDKMDWGSKEPEGTFRIANGNFEIVIHNENSDQPTTVNIEVDLDGRAGPSGEPDMILYDPDNPDASHALINRMQKALDEKAPGAFEVSIDRSNRISIVSKKQEYTIAFGEDTSGVVAALGMNVLFTGRTAMTMGVNEEIAENPALLGGEASFLEGDNNGANLLLDMRNKKIANLNNLTLDDFYLTVTGRLGSEAKKAIDQKNLSCDVLNRMFTQRESISGVNEDEEVSKLMSYQRSFQSAAKFISTVDQLYETLINL
jgi:flagellar hook-associated protein 1 FlgK